MKKRLILVPIAIIFFLLAGFSTLQAQTDTSIISMQGAGWTLKVDGQVMTAEVKSAPTVSAAKDQAGAKELSLTLNSLDECKTGIVQFKVETTGLTCYKQLPLTEQEIKDGSVRPENVVNSYACFDQTGKKVLHIYASKLIDAKGNTCWVDQTLKDTTLTVYLNDTWLQSAVFPVVLDPTFGYTLIGASSTTTSATISQLYPLSSASTINSLYVYISDSSGNWIEGAIYESDGTRIALTNVFTATNDTAYWLNLTFSPPLELTAGNYFLSVNPNANNNKDGTLYNDWSPSATIWADSVILPDPIVHDWGIVTDKSYSIYADYSVVPIATATPAATTGTAANMEFAFLIFLIILNLALIIWPRVPILGFVVAIPTFAVVAVIGSNSTGIPFYPLPSVFLAFIALTLLFRSGLAWRAQ